MERPGSVQGDPHENRAQEDKWGPKQARVWSRFHRLRIIGFAYNIHDRLLFVAIERRKAYSATSSRLEVKGRNVDITEVAQRTGLTASTLRFYEEKGLIASIGRRGLHRVFDPKVLERLALIALGRSAGFSLDE